MWEYMFMFLVTINFKVQVLASVDCRLNYVICLLLSGVSLICRIEYCRIVSKYYTDLVFFQVLWEWIYVYQEKVLSADKSLWYPTVWWSSGRSGLHFDDCTVCCSSVYWLQSARKYITHRSASSYTPCSFSYSIRIFWSRQT